jgi:hypothetical protein
VRSSFAYPRLVALRAYRIRSESGGKVKITLLILGLFFAGVGSLLAVSGYLWQSHSAKNVDRLHRASTMPRTIAFNAAEFARIPQPVVRYFRTVLDDAQPIVRHVLLTQRGQFLVRPTPDGWRPFDAMQHFATHPGGFVWDAGIRLAAGLTIRVRDAFVDGAGSMVGRLMGLWRLVSVAHTPEIAAGALQRYLAESVWFPTALLPSQGVIWTGLDDSSARATLTVGATTVSLDFSFGADGLIKGVFTPARPRDVSGRAVPTPWQGYFARYESHGRMKIPMAAEVEWVLPEGPQKYWRGEITSIAFEFWQAVVADQVISFTRKTPSGRPPNHR